MLIRLMYLIARVRQQQDQRRSISLLIRRILKSYHQSLLKTNQRLLNFLIWMNHMIIFI